MSPDGNGEPEVLRPKRGRKTDRVPEPKWEGREQEKPGERRV